MDCTFLTDTGKFNVRVCALVQHEGRVLLGRCENDDYWHTVGGRLKTGETLKDGAERECREETGAALHVRRLAAFCENFFAIRGTPFHELSVYYEMEALLDAHVIPSEFYEAGCREELRWFPLDELHACPLLPPFIGELLQRRAEWPLHIVRREGKEGCTLCEPLR